MERVAFLVETTGERLSCMLNPESLTLRHTAGIAVGALAGGDLAGRGAMAGRAVFTGGGLTEVELDLVFDISLAGDGPVRPQDVRDLTAPLTRLAANRSDDPASAPQPPVLRFVWGKAWNLRAVVRALSERLENFDAAGRPRRSWLRLRLLELPEPDDSPASGPGPAPLGIADALPLPGPVEAALSLLTAPASATPGERIDEIAARVYGHPGLWRLIAQANDLDRPDLLPQGVALTIPALGQG